MLDRNEWICPAEVPDHALRTVETFHGHVHELLAGLPIEPDWDAFIVTGPLHLFVSLLGSALALAPVIAADAAQVGLIVYDPQTEPES